MDCCLPLDLIGDEAGHELRTSDALLESAPPVATPGGFGSLALLVRALAVAASALPGRSRTEPVGATVV